MTNSHIFYKYEILLVNWLFSTITTLQPLPSDNFPNGFHYLNSKAKLFTVTSLNTPPPPPPLLNNNNHPDRTNQHTNSSVKSNRSSLPVNIRPAYLRIRINIRYLSHLGHGEQYTVIDKTRAAMEIEAVTDL